jgi:hypothetical protein
MRFRKAGIDSGRSHPLARLRMCRKRNGSQVLMDADSSLDHVFFPDSATRINEGEAEEAEEVGADI